MKILRLIFFAHSFLLFPFLAPKNAGHCGIPLASKQSLSAQT